MWMPILGLVIGIFLGFLSSFNIDANISHYLAIALLAALDSIFGGIRARLEKNFENAVFITGFFTNTLIAGLLTYLGDRLGVDLMLAATVTFGIRIFQNLSIIRRLVLKGKKTESL
ncbi:MAG: small basic family protein [Bacillota bacterium]